MEKISFYNEISKNKRKSIFLIVISFLILFGLIFAIAFSVDEIYFFDVMIIGTIATIIYMMVSLTQTNTIILKSVHAIPANKFEYKEFYNIVEGLCLASGLPVPKLYIMKDSQINAFATGKNPQESVICVTTGAIEKLDKQELEGVISHELSHIANYDIRFMSLISVIVGMISIISQVFLRSFWFSSGNDSDNRNPIFMLIALVLAIISPLLIAIVQFAISRKREYLADSTGVKFTRSPTGLINALKKIKKDTAGNVKVPGSVEALFFAKPRKTNELFQTHPPIDERIKILEKM